MGHRYNCSACNTSVKGRQTSTFSTLPPYLMLNVNNYAQFGNAEVKLCKYKLQPVLFMGSLYPNDQVRKAQDVRVQYPLTSHHRSRRHIPRS